MSVDGARVDLAELQRAVRGKAHAPIQLVTAPGVSSSRVTHALFAAAFAGVRDVDFEFDGSRFSGWFDDTGGATRTAGTALYLTLSDSIRLTWQSRSACSIVPESTSLPLTSSRQELQHALAERCAGGAGRCFDYLVLDAEPDVPFERSARAFVAAAPFGTGTRLPFRLGTPVMRAVGAPLKREPPVVPPRLAIDRLCEQPIAWLGADEIVKVLADRRADLAACFAGRPSAEPIYVSLALTLRTDGRTTDVVTDARELLARAADGGTAPTALTDAATLSCVVDVHRNLTFPKHGGAPLRVMYPLIREATYPKAAAP